MPQEALLQKFAPIVLRYALTALLLWFGASQVTAPDAWLSWVPLWVPDTFHMSARLIVLLNGGFEVVGGILLLLGIYVRWVALVMALHIFSIAYEVGYNDIGVRDFCLGVACLAISLYGNDAWSLQRTNTNTAMHSLAP